MENIILSEDTHSQTFIPGSIIRVTDQHDIKLFLRAQNAMITGATLPSGLKMPSAPEDHVWRVISATTTKLVLNLEPKTNDTILTFDTNLEIFVPESIIRVTDLVDINLFCMAQGAMITGATLPSGRKMPSAPENHVWKIISQTTSKLVPTL